MFKSKSGWTPSPEQISRRRSRAVKCLAVPFLLCMSGGAFAGAASENVDSIANDKAKAAHSSANLELKAAQKNLSEASEEAGSDCMLVMTDYLLEGRLDSASSSSATDDLLAEPGQPCGQNRRKARGLLELVRSTTKEQSVTSNKYAEASERLESTIKAEQENEFEEKTTLWSLIGAASGTAIALLGVMEYNSTKRIDHASEIRYSSRKAEIDQDYVEYQRQLELQQAAKELSNE